MLRIFLLSLDLSIHLSIYSFFFFLFFLHIILSPNMHTMFMKYKIEIVSIIHPPLSNDFFKDLPRTSTSTSASSILNSKDHSPFARPLASSHSTPLHHQSRQFTHRTAIPRAKTKRLYLSWQSINPSTKLIFRIPLRNSTSYFLCRV